MNIKHAISKYIISASTLIALSALIALTGTSSWGAAQPNAQIAAAMADAAERGDAARVNQLAPIALATNASFNDLPNELLVQIAGLLDEKNLIKIAQVNSRWNQIATSMPLFQESFLKHYKGNLTLALFHAAVDNHPWAINFLIRKGVDINTVATPSDMKMDAGYSPRTALTLAIRYGHENVVAELLKNGAHTDVAESDHFTPLMVAASGGKKSIVELLIKAGADVNLSLTGQSPLVLAANYDHEEIVNLLIESGARLDTALREAIVEYPAAIPLLLKHGANISLASKNMTHATLQKAQRRLEQLKQSKRSHFTADELAKIDQKNADLQHAIDAIMQALQAIPERASQAD